MPRRNLQCIVRIDLYVVTRTEKQGEKNSINKNAQSAEAVSRSAVL